VRIDPGRGESGVRSRDMGFGGGEITHDPLEPRLYETDFFQNTLRVIDSRTLDVIRETPLGFPPRPVAVAPGRDLVAVGSWMDGVVHFLRRGSGEQLDIAIPVGPYLRELAFDDERGMLFAGSKCGVTLIDVAALGL
jgi:DNA-binding beta-propeller fold protein YncE